MYTNLLEKWFDSSKNMKLSMYLSTDTFFGKEPTTLIKITLAERDDQYLSPEDLARGATGWSSCGTAYFYPTPEGREAAEEFFERWRRDRKRPDHGDISLNDLPIDPKLDKKVKEALDQVILIMRDYPPNSAGDLISRLAMFNLNKKVRVQEGLDKQGLITDIRDGDDYITLTT